MRHAAWWLGVLWLVAGCVPSLDDLHGPCTADGDCARNDYCDQQSGYCVPRPQAPDAGCTPACKLHEACTEEGCKPQFVQLTILTPANDAVVGGGALPVVTRLLKNPAITEAASYPDSLIFRATRNGGGSAGTFGAVTRNEDTYLTTWTPPGGDTSYTLAVEHPSPEAGLSSAVTVTLDTRPPVFTVTVPPPSQQAMDGGTSYSDPDPGSLTQLWRRDQQVLVQVRTNEPNLDTSTLRLTVKGTDGVGTAPVPITRDGQDGGVPGDCDAGFCGVAQVNLWEPTFNAFRGTLPIEVEGRDRAGNTGIVSPSSSTGINVTRWKWAFQVQGPIKASPAVGQQGVVYLGTAQADGRVFALHADGTKKWEVATDAVEGSPVVGDFVNGTELVYVASNYAGVPSVGSGVKLGAINGADGMLLPATNCNFNATAGTPPRVISAGALTKTAVEGTPTETALFVVSGSYGSAVGIRPVSIGSTTLRCVNSDSTQQMPSSTANSGLVANDTGQFAYPTDTRRVLKYTFGDGVAKWTALAGGGGGQSIVGLALLGNQLMCTGGNTAAEGGVFQIAFDSVGTPTPAALPATENGRVSQLVAGADGHLYYGREFTGAGTQVVRYSLAASGVASSSLETGVIPGAGVLGTDGRLYTVNTDGELAAWAALSLARQWRLSGLGSSVEASPTLDCARDAQGTPLGTELPGVIYIAAGDKLYAFVVDSPRLPKEGWPKYQHDARNTGNPSTSITQCP